MFENLYNLISTHIFGGNPSAFAYGEFICEAIPAVACCILIALPFVVVWRFIRTFL